MRSIRNPTVSVFSLVRMTLPSLLGAVLLLATGSVAAGTLYKWIDEDGQIRYSDRLPASQAKKKHQQLNRQGVVVSTTEEARSEEDLAAEAEAKRKQEEADAEAARLKAIQDKKDQVLLLTFSSEEELKLARDNRIDVLDSVIKLINKSIATSQQKLVQLETSAEQNFTSKGNEIPGGLAQKIEEFTRKIENRNAQLKLKMAEKDKINENYERDRARYRELKSAEAEAGTTQSTN